MCGSMSLLTCVVWLPSRKFCHVEDLTLLTGSQSRGVKGVEDRGHPPLRRDEDAQTKSPRRKTFDFSETMVADSCCSVKA